MAKKKVVDLAMEPREADVPVDVKSPEEMTGIDPIIALCRDRLSEADQWWATNYESARQDVRFAYEDQWDEGDRSQRGNRPTLTLNHLPQFIHQVTGNARQAKFAIRVNQTGGMFDKLILRDGTTSMPRHEVMEGLIRDIEHRSRAHRAYCRAHQHAVESGIGWLGVYPHRDKDNPFEMELRIKHFKDRWSILIDPHCQEDDFSDARWVAQTVAIDHKEFKKRYPDSSPLSWHPQSYSWTTHHKFWGQGDGRVAIVDYWWKEPMKRTAIKLMRETDTMIVFEDDEGPVLDELQEAGFEEVGRTEIMTDKVMYARLTYNEFLDGPHDWPSSFLPIVPVMGRQFNTQDSDNYVGLTRYTHDSQRMLNYWGSAATERTALAPKNPFLIDAEQIAGYEREWRDQQTANAFALVYNAREGVERPTRDPGPAMPTAELQLLDTMRRMLQETIGLHDASLGRRSNEVSGVAIDARRSQGDTSTFEFTDELAHSISRVGDILCDMIPRIYSGPVTRRLVLPDDTMAAVDLNHDMEDRGTGRTFRIALDGARYSCAVDVGPASTTQRQEFVRMLTELGQQVPEAMSVSLDLIFKNMGIPYSAEISRRLKALIPRHVLSEKDQQEIPPPQPTPAEQVEMAKSEAQVKVAELNVEIAKARAKEAEIKLQFETQRGLNRELVADEQAKKMLEDGDDKDMDDKELEKKVRNFVAKALAEKS